MTSMMLLLYCIKHQLIVTSNEVVVIREAKTKLNKSEKARSESSKGKQDKQMSFELSSEPHQNTQNIQKLSSQFSMFVPRTSRAHLGVMHCMSQSII